MLPSRKHVALDISLSLRHATAVFVCIAANQVHQQERNLTLLGDLLPCVPGRRRSVDAVSNYPMPKSQVVCRNTVGDDVAFRTKRARTSAAQERLLDRIDPHMYSG